MNFVENLLKTNSHIHIHNDKRAYVEQIICSLILDGRKMLHIVTDFDSVDNLGWNFIVFKPEVHLRVSNLLGIFSHKKIHK